MQAMNLARYRELLRGRRTRRVLIGLAVSALGDGMSTVTSAWLGVRVAPAGELGVFVGLAVASYTLPGVIGALVFGRVLRARPARALVLMHCLLRTGFLGAVAALWGVGAPAPAAYVGLLAGSSVLSAWGNSGQYTMLSELGGPDGRLAINSLATAQVSFAVIVGPSVAGGGGGGGAGPPLGGGPRPLPRPPPAGGVFFFPPRPGGGPPAVFGGARL